MYADLNNTPSFSETLKSKRETPFARTLLDDTTAAEARTTLGAAAATTLSRVVSLEDAEFTALFSGGDHTPALVAAISAARVVLIPATRTWSFTGTFPIASGCSIIFVGTPTINLTVDGDQRGFHFDSGTTNAHIKGAATINLTVNVAASDGSYSSAIAFGRFYHTSDPAKIERCSVVGPITVNCLGPQNGKPVHVYGYAEDITVEGVTATGTTNFSFSAHWAGNGSSGVLPTKTWHPHNLEFRNCKAVSPLRGFTASGCGTVVYNGCNATGATTIGFNLFVGDYGYTYAQNISNRQAARFFLNECSASGTGTGLTLDQQSSGLNSSPIWTGSDHNAGLFIDGLDVLISSGATNTVGAALSFARTVEATGLRIVEEGTSNATQPLTVFGCGSVTLRGRMRVRFGALVRASRHVDIDMPTETPLEEPDSARYGVSASATSGAATTSGAVAVGGTSVTLVGNTISVGQGGFLLYNDGSTDHEIDIRTSTYTSGNQTVEIAPSPVLIPDGATVTVIQTVKSLRIGASPITGYASAVRCTGSATAKVRNVLLDGSQFYRCGIYDVDMSAVAGFRAIGTFHDRGGQRTTTTNRRGISLGSNAEGFVVSGAHFGKNCTRLQYLVYIDNSATRGFVGGCLFESINSAASNPAAIFKNTATEVTIGTNHTVTGVTAVYP